MGLINSQDSNHKGYRNLSDVFGRKKQRLCANYLGGFCPKGPYCKLKHLKSVIIDEQTSLSQIANFPESESTIASPNKSQKSTTHKLTICHNCGQEGHKSTYCQEDKIDKVNLQKILESTMHMGHDRVLCFNCSTYGHYANMCPLKQDKFISGTSSAQSEKEIKRHELQPSMDKLLLNKRTFSHTSFHHQIDHHHVLKKQTSRSKYV